MSEADVLNQIVAGIQSKFDVKRIVLFGSRARGDANSESDFDVLAEVESDMPFFRRQTEALKSFRRRTWSLDLLVMTPSEIESSARTLGSAVYWALREGKTIYERQ